ncbi:type IV secretory system conjugative DNA transfer family protein [Mucilaginibacter calamicampi]|uniref:Type IV secretory system conjugative DNA transfer family protein n=1 Tax=Mucilaginibacter calamicampi TaxID=1302352 RepID=A0ABW2YVX1_9SPHI
MEFKEKLKGFQWALCAAALLLMIAGINRDESQLIFLSLFLALCAVLAFIRFQKHSPAVLGISDTFFNQLRTLQMPIGVIGVGLLTVGIVTWTIFCIVISLGLMFLWYVLFKANNANSGPKTDHGSARWATYEEMKATGNSEPHGLYIGYQHMRNKSGHLLTVAGSGQGKGVNLIIPSLLVNPFGSYVVTDPKGENAFITARFQKEFGQRVYIIDPWDEQKKLGAIHGIQSSGFNPFAFLKKNMHELRDNCEQIANFLIPDKPDAKDPFWNDRARSMIKTFLMHIVTAMPEEDHNFWTLYKMLRLSGDDWLMLLFDLKNNKAEHELISIAAEELIGIQKTENTMASIRSTAQNATTIFESPQLRQSLAKDDFDPYYLTSANCTVYIVIPERYLDTHGVWLRLVIGLCLKACNEKPGLRVNFILDEFAVLGKMKDIQKGYAFARGQNIVLWAFVQSLSQIKDIYGDDGLNTFIGNAAVLQAFGIKDYFTADYISKLLGEATLEKISTTVSHNPHTRDDNRSLNYQTYGRRLLTVDEVTTFPHIITFADNLKIQIQKLPYFKSFFENVKLTPQQQKDRDSGKAIEWFDYFKKRADPPPRINH